MCCQCSTKPLRSARLEIGHGKDSLKKFLNVLGRLLTFTLQGDLIRFTYFDIVLFGSI